jgi:hypothetical protein
MRQTKLGTGSNFYPVRNNAPLLPPGQRPSGPAAAAGLHFRIIPAGSNAPLEFLTGFIDEGDRKRLADQALKILSKETASREKVMAEIEEILSEKKRNH